MNCQLQNQTWVFDGGKKEFQRKSTLLSELTYNLETQDWLCMIIWLCIFKSIWYIKIFKKMGFYGIIYSFFQPVELSLNYSKIRFLKHVRISGLYVLGKRALENPQDVHSISRIVHSIEVSTNTFWFIRFGSQKILPMHWHLNWLHLA